MRLLAAPPVRLRVGQAVRALLDGVGDPGFRTSRVCHRAGRGPPGPRRVMKQRRDRLVLGAALLDHQPGDPEQVGDVWTSVRPPHLAGVSPRRVAERVREPARERIPEGSGARAIAWVSVSSTKVPHQATGPRPPARASAGTRR